MGSLCSSPKDKEGASPSDRANPVATVTSNPSHPSSGNMPTSWITEKVRQRQPSRAMASSYSSADEYYQKRQMLLTREKDMAFDAKAIADASPLERRANAMVNRIRRADELGVYAKKVDKYGHKRAPADHFLGNVDLINQTELFKVAREMPKGAHLHCHFNSCLSPTFLIRHARGMKTMYIRSTLPLLSEETFRDAEISFQVLLETNEAQRLAASEAFKVNLFDEDYSPLSWMPYPVFCEKFRGGTEAAEEWLEEKMLLTEEEIHGTHQTGYGCWDRFNICTRMLKGLFGYESAFRAYTRACIDDFVKDNIQYAEIRPNFPSNVLAKDDGSGVIDNTGLMRIISEELEAKIREYGASKRYFGGLKVIYCCPRSFGNELVGNALKECIELKKKFPDLLCGFDLVGAEDRGEPLKKFIPELLEFRASCNRQKLDIPFLFHCGETLETGGDTDENLFDAIMLDSKRIGHGFALPKHPLALELIKEKDIALEICPISNEILHLCPTIEGHTITTLLANNVHCTVNSDNATFYQSSLSHDFYQVMVGSKSMSLHGWRVLAEWSLDHSCMDSKQKVVVKKEWLSRWDAFCDWLVREYGERYPEEQ